MWNIEEASRLCLWEELRHDPIRIAYHVASFAAFAFVAAVVLAII